MIVNYPGNDIYPMNDTVYSYFTITFGDEFSYSSGHGNEVGDAVRIPGKGLNLGGARFSGFQQATGATMQHQFQHHGL